MKKSELINILESLKGFENPKIKLEQYNIDAAATADLMYYIQINHGDICNKNIIDLGCGTGNLSIAARFMGAKVLAVDIDQDALSIFKENREKYDLLEEILVFQADLGDDSFAETITDFIGSNREYFESDEPSLTSKDFVVITNPPFGVHKKGADLLFLKRAMNIADIIYSIHQYNPDNNDENYEYLHKKIQEMGGKIEERSKLDMQLVHSYKFHKQNRKKITTQVFKIVKN